MKEKIIIAEKAQRLIEMTAGFSDEYLDEDYKQLCVKLIRKMSRKRNVPFLSGRIEIWAAAIVYALGSINFLFDRGSDPYVSRDDICNYFGTSRNTTSQKAKIIRDMFKLGYWDNEFSTSYMMQNSPFLDLLLIDGLIADKYSLSQEIQEGLWEKKNSKKMV